MKKNWLARTGLIIALGAVPLALALPASAADNPAKGTGLTGACNMLAGVGMGHAMTVNATQGTNGNDGMWRAVDVSGCA